MKNIRWQKKCNRKRLQMAKNCLKKPNMAKMAKYFGQGL